jgi:lysozyme family protein
MDRNFSRSLAAVLVYEGGKVDHPKDPGGRTNQGVIQRVYDAFRRRKKVPVRDVYDMADAERDEIYRNQYWDAVRGDELPDGVDFVVFDGGVNSGPKQSIKWLQRALGVTADGVIGAVTMSAIEDCGDYDALVARILDRREAFLRSLKTFPTFGKGWMSRLNQVLKTGQAWATGKVAPQPKPIKDAGVKALIEDAKKAPPKGMADAATGAGMGSGGLGYTVNQLQEQLTPFSLAGDWIGKLVVVLIIISAVLTVGGLAYRWWATRKKDALADALDTPVAAASP